MRFVRAVLFGNFVVLPVFVGALLPLAGGELAVHLATANGGPVLAERRTGPGRTADRDRPHPRTACFATRTPGCTRPRNTGAAASSASTARCAINCCGSSGSPRTSQARSNAVELHLDYQPLMALEDDTVSGVEALLRWTHPIHGAVSPGEFIPVAEEHGLIVPIGRWVLDTALRQLARWSRSDTALRDATVSVNLSVRQLTGDDLAATVTRLLATHDIAPERLCLELTESALMAEPEAGRQVLGHLRRAGVQLAIDDFGTGYSSLAYPRELPVTSLKIDRSFITRLGSNARDERLVAATINLAHELDLTVVAEGVETAG